MCDHLDGKEIIACNVYGRLIKDKGRFYLMPHECCANNIKMLDQYLPLLLELLIDANMQYSEFIIKLNGRTHLTIEVKPYAVQAK